MKPTQFPLEFTMGETQPTPSVSDILNAPKGIVRRHTSIIDVLKFDIASLNASLLIKFKDINGKVISQQPFDFQQKVEELSNLFGKGAKFYVPEYGRLLSEVSLNDPLWSVGFYDGITVIVVLPENIKSYTENSQSSLKTLFGVEEIQVASTQPQKSVEAANAMLPHNKLLNQSTQNSPGINVPPINTNNPIISPDKENKTVSNIGTTKVQEQEIALTKQTTTSSQINNISQPLLTSTQLSQTNEITSPSKGSTSSKTNNKPTKYHFIVKGPEVKVFYMEPDTEFAVIFEQYDNISQGKKPTVKFADKVVNITDTPKTINAVIDRHNILQLTMVDNVEKFKISIIDPSKTLNPLFFNVKTSAKIKKVVKKYTDIKKIPEKKLEFYIKGKKLTKASKAKTLQSFGFNENETNEIIVKMLR